MGIPFEVPANLFCDKNPAFIKSTRHESTLKRKHNSIVYHIVREVQAGTTVRISKEGTSTNLANIFKKILPGPELRY